MHDEIRRNLVTTRTHLLESQILIQTLSDLPSKAADLPPELHAVIELVTAQLNGHIPDSNRETLSGDVSLFLENIDKIALAVSVQLNTVLSHLCVIADPQKPPEIDRLSTKAQTLRDEATHDLPSELAAGRVELANTAYKVLTTHRRVLESSIRILEQTMHGSLARATKTKAEYMHARATVLGLQARIHTHAHPPPAEFVAALRNFKDSQGASEVALRDRESLARKALELYDRAGEKAMKDIAKRATYLHEEIARMQEEIEKLERSK
ncbi:hypothetical protein K504DRAFT_468859 [Pleomassaria siparia CBS 279.74]|uniref:Uncharacterized protein n=1 Tax=Pleomassaria siparia CBS 279.74 TaxID=1314801 RepID=A0A6G1K6T7_9PLEO|nr:hypothetical protein K504DRAFT_468859 [Pleomassaria siparia CBS 279.74]